MSAGADLLASIFGDDELSQVAEPPIVEHLSFTVAREVLLPLLDRACTVVPTRDVMPVLKCLQFHVDPQRLRIIATDADKTLLTSTTRIATHWPGVAVFPAKKLLEIVKAAEDGEVAIKVSGTVATVRIGRAMWTLALQSGADFPALPDVGDAEFVQVDRKAFCDAVTAVRYAASRDPARANLNVIDIKDGRLTASDGSRIQQVALPQLSLSMRVPVSAIDDLMRLLKHSSTDTLHVGQSASRLIFRFAGDVFMVSKEHGSFPDLEATMLRPALENKHQLWVPKAALLAAIKRVRINADPDSAGIALSLGPNTVTVTTTDKYGNTAGETVACDYAGPARVLVVHHGFLTDMINTYGDTTCAFKLGDDTKTRRSPLMLRHEATGSVGVTQQMQTDWASR